MPMPQIDPAVYDDILGMGGQISGMDPQIAAQQQQAQLMRGSFGKFPQEARMSGRRAVAPNPLELLGALSGQAMGGRADRRATTMQGQQGDLRQKQIQLALAAMMRQQQPQGGVNASGVQPIPSTIPGDPNLPNARGDM